MKYILTALKRALATTLLLCGTVAFAAKPLYVFFVPGIWQHDWIAFDNEFTSLAALKEAVESAPQYASYIGSDSQQYPYFNYDLILNPTDDSVDLSRSKSNEEVYLDSLRSVLQEGSYYAPNTARKLRAIYDMYLPNESEYLRGVITKGFKRVCTLLRANTDVVMVAHSHGNIIANFIYAGAAQGCGDSALLHLRVVAVGSVSEFSPNNLMVNQDTDATVYSALPELSGFIPRATPYCNGTLCPFTPPRATVISNCDQGFGCHKFAASYLSPTIVGTASLGERLSSSAYLVSGTSMRLRVSDAFFTALDSIHRDSHEDASNHMRVTNDIYWTTPDVTSGGVGKFELHSAGPYSSFIYGQQQYAQAGIVTVKGCMAPSLKSGGAFALQDVNFAGIFGSTGQANAQPTMGVTVDWSDPGNLRLIDANGQIKRVTPTMTDGRYCGTFQFGVCPDRTSFAQFTNSADRQVYRQGTGIPTVPVLRRFFALQYQNDVMTITSLREQPYIFPAPYSTDPRVTPPGCALPTGSSQ